MEIPQVQFLEKVVDVPVVCDVRCLIETVQETVEVPQLQCVDKVVDVPVVQVVDVGFVQFLDKVVGMTVGQGSAFAVHRQGPHYGGGDRVFSAGLTHFSRSSRSSGVERQFSEPSMVKSSLPSRAPTQ